MPKVLVAPCLKWWGHIAKSRYGVIYDKVTRKYQRAHRFIWEQCFGAIPNGNHVLHHCDHPWCVAPDHLYLGSHQDNMRDRQERGRTARGEKLRTKRPQNKLTWRDARDIRALHKQGMALNKIAALYPCTRYQIANIVHNRQWRED